MDKKIVFRKAGKNSFKEVDLDEILKDVIEIKIYSEKFKLYKKTGRPRTIMHQWLFEELCKFSDIKLDEIMDWTEGTRKEILKEYYGKQYIESESSKKIFEEIEKRNIPMDFGD